MSSEEGKEQEAFEIAPITLGQLNLIRSIGNLSEAYAMQADSESYSQNKKSEETSKRIREILNYFADCACKHDFIDFGKTLKRCKICQSTRVKP